MCGCAWTKRRHWGCRWSSALPSARCSRSHRQSLAPAPISRASRKSWKSGPGSKSKDRNHGPQRHRDTESLQASLCLWVSVVRLIGGSMPDKATFDKGLQIRKDTLGAEFVENSFKTADDFTMPMQELTTEYCWGYVWGRDTLPRKTRSMLNLAMISALNRPHELKMHVKGALKNG